MTDAEKPKTLSQQIQAWHFGQLIVACVGVFVVATLLISGMDQRGDPERAIGRLYLAAFAADLWLAWVWFGGRKKPSS